MSWSTLAPIAQTLFFTAGVVAIVLIVLVCFQIGEHQRREHEKLMLMAEQILREVLKK
jgi:hypothetical protein